MKHAIRWTVGFFLALAGCGGGEEATPEPDAGETAVLMVRTVNYPLQYIAGRIGGDAVEVICPVPAGVDPAQWSPDPQAVAVQWQRRLWPGCMSRM